jgi:lipoyl(octanoyl) transferase
MEVRDLGLVPYAEALALQLAERARVQAGESDGVLLLLEHPPVYTLGRRSEPGDLAMGEDWYRAQGIEIVRTDRGGKLTYHGPGQLVGYPVVRVERIGDHVCAMEKAIVAALAEQGIEARGRDAEGAQFTGVWVEDRKIASIGIHVSRGVAIHGFAVNVDNDLQPFEWAVACGLPDVRMTSVCRETGRSGTLPAVAERIATELAGVPA